MVVMPLAAPIAWSALCIWLYLIAAHGRFWRTSPELTPAIPRRLPAIPRRLPAIPYEWPEVDILVPARDEAPTIAAALGSLLAQDYGGAFRVILIDDGSSDGTAELAAAVAAAARPTIIRGAAKPPDWSGKLWALNQGIAASRAPVLLFTDADIVHDSRHLATLVAKLVGDRLDLVSEMVRLNCDSRAERLLVPAFVYFFQMLYPFAKVNDPRSSSAAAAGGTVLVRRTALARIGGLDSIKDALIDDVSLARAIKLGGPIYLGHSSLAKSIRSYPRASDLWQMISRTAFTQLRYSSGLLAVTLAGLLWIWWVPVAALLLGRGSVWLSGAGACFLAIASYQPTLARYGRSPLWSLLLPIIALFFMAATLYSAFKHWRGKGATWKNRAYGAAGHRTP